MTWDKYFLNMLDNIAIKSKDKSLKIGAIIVKNNRIISTGYNGLPSGLFDVESRILRPDKYSWTEHAERNAIYSAARFGISLNDSDMFISLFPCAACARGIIQSGIRRVIIKNNQAALDYGARWKNSITISREMLLETGVIITENYND